MIARSVAACLVLLIALPFTAPFATSGFGDASLVLSVGEDVGGDGKVTLDIALAPGVHAESAPVCTTLFHGRAVEIGAGAPAQSASPLPLRV